MNSFVGKLFIWLLAASLLTTASAQGQQPGKVYRVGVLVVGGADIPAMEFSSLGQAYSERASIK